MKKKGVIVLLTSIVIAAIGSVLKIKHIGGADFFLALGMITLFVAIGMILYGIARPKPLHNEQVK